MRPQGHYIRLDLVSPVTGTRVQVLDLTHDESTRGPGRLVVSRNADGTPVRVRLLRWGSACVEHDQVVEHEVLTDAKASADDPTDWCVFCARTPISSGA